MRNGKSLGMLASFLACAAIPYGALAAKWLEVGVATNGAKVFVDAQSLTGGSGWVRLNQRFVFADNGSQPLSRVEQQVVYACGSRTVRTLRSVEFNKLGRVVRVDGLDAVPPYRISSGTLPRYVFDLVC